MTNQFLTNNKRHVRSFFFTFDSLPDRVLKNKETLGQYSDEITIYWGEHDPFLPKEIHLPEIMNIVPKENIFIIKDAKHYIPHTHARELSGLITGK